MISLKRCWQSKGLFNNHQHTNKGLCFKALYTWHLRNLTNWPNVLTFYKKQLFTNHTSSALVINLVFWSWKYFQLSLQRKLLFVEECIFLHFLPIPSVRGIKICYFLMYLNGYLLFSFSSNSKPHFLS